MRPTSMSVPMCVAYSSGYKEIAEWILQSLSISVFSACCTGTISPMCALIDAVMRSTWRGHAPLVAAFIINTASSMCPDILTKSAWRSQSGSSSFATRGSRSGMDRPLNMLMSERMVDCIAADLVFISENMVCISSSLPSSSSNVQVQSSVIVEGGDGRSKMLSP